MSCTNDFDEIIDLLRSGLPTYDYEPTADLAELVQQVDVVVAGAIDSISRTVDTESVYESSWTVISSGDA